MGREDWLLLRISPMGSMLPRSVRANDDFSFAGTGSIAVTIAWFLLPEVTRRTPAEIDELYVLSIRLHCLV